MTSASAAFAAFSAMFQASPTTGPLTLDQAVAIAEKQAFSILVQRSAVEKAALGVGVAEAAYIPNIAANVNANRFDSATYSNFGGSSILTNPRDTSAVSASISFPLDVNGSLKNRLRSARELRRASEETLQARLRDVRLTVRQAYFGVLRAKAAVVVQQQALEQAVAQRDQARLQFKGDQIARVNVRRYEAQVAQSESDLIAAKNSLDLAKNGLNQTLARPIDTAVELIDITALTEVRVSVDDAVATAKTIRPEVRSLLNTIQALESSRHVTEASGAPSLSIGGQYQRSLGDIGATSQRSSMVGVIQLSIPISAAATVRKQVQQARQDELQAKLQLAELQLGISADVRAAYTNLQSASARFKSATEQVSLAEEVYRIAQIRRDAGEGTYVEVIDALTDLTRARNQLNNARFDYLVAYSQLQRAVGSDTLTAPASSNDQPTPKMANVPSGDHKQ